MWSFSLSYSSSSFLTWSSKVFAVLQPAAGSPKVTVGCSARCPNELRWTKLEIKLVSRMLDNWCQCKTGVRAARPTAAHSSSWCHAGESSVWWCVWASCPSSVGGGLYSAAECRQNSTSIVNLCEPLSNHYRDSCPSKLKTWIVAWADFASKSAFIVLSGAALWEGALVIMRSMAPPRPSKASLGMTGASSSWQRDRRQV